VPERSAPKIEVLDLVSHVNSETFDIYPPTTLIFDRPGWERITMPNGMHAFNIHYYFKYNPRGWLRVPDPNANNEFYMVGRHGVNEERLYQGGDFKKLFRPIIDTAAP
jgi:hypothetical protein